MRVRVGACAPTCVRVRVRMRASAIVDTEKPRPRTHTHAHARARTPTRAHTHTRTRAHTHTRAHNAHARASTRACAHARTHAHARAFDIRTRGVETPFHLRPRRSSVPVRSRPVAAARLWVPAEMEVTPFRGPPFEERVEIGGNCTSSATTKRKEWGQGRTTQIEGKPSCAGRWGLPQGQTWNGRG